MTLAERLLAGEHHGCANWADAARKLGTSDRTLRVVRKALEARGTPAELTAKTATPMPDSKWPSVAAFDEGPDFLDEILAERPNVARILASDYPEPLTFRNPEALPYQPPTSPMVRKLTQAECPTGSRILWVSDVHIPIHNEAALRLMVECAERSGVTHVVAGGDIFDFNCLSQHDKEAYRTVEHATLLEEVEPGRWFMDWLATKRSILILGNHEGRLNRFVDRNPAFHGSVLSNFAQLVNLPRGIEVVPQGGSVRLGNLSMRHMDAEFKNSGGGKYPAQRVLDMYPDESNIGGHCHRKSVARRTTRDEDGIKRTRCVWMMGHMSNEDDHLGYMSPSPNWQTGFGFVDVYWVDGRPRWTVTQVEVLFDTRNRPYFQFERHVYGVVA